MGVVEEVRAWCYSRRLGVWVSPGQINVGTSLEEASSFEFSRVCCGFAQSKFGGLPALFADSLFAQSIFSLHNPVYVLCDCVCLFWQDLTTVLRKVKMSVSQDQSARRPRVTGSCFD